MRSILLVTLLVALLPVCFAWGPLSHYLFACQSAFFSAPIQPQPQLEPLFIGADLPDGLWNGWFLSGTQCSQLANHLHSPIFAGYMVQEAIANPDYNKDPYYLSFAYGFATHTVGDEVGFATQGGYLGNLSSIIDWSTEWPFMLSVDAYLLQNNSFPAECPMPTSEPKAPLEQQGLEFLAYVDSVYNAANPKFPLLNATQLQQCSDPWAPQVNEMNAIAASQLPSATIQQLLFFDRFGATTQQDVEANLEASFRCVQATYAFFFKTITDLSQKPEDVWTATANYITSLYEQNLCTVAPIKKQ